MKTYTGGCHCGAVRYEVIMDLEKTGVCNCSHCHKKEFILKFVDTDKFTLLSGEEQLTTYQFNKKHIDHVFCKICGVQSFARSPLFPKIMVNVRCIDEVDTDTLTLEKHNGKDL